MKLPRSILGVIILLVPACMQLPRQDDIDQPPLRPVAAPHHVLFVADGAGGFPRLLDVGPGDGRRRRLASRCPHVRLVPRLLAELFGPRRIQLCAGARPRTRGSRDGPETAAARYPRVADGHSDGSGVVLAAAEQLPPETLDRIILFAPGVSVDYDLRGALRAVRNGIEVFWSPEDRVYLGAFAVLGGAQDNESQSRTAGRYGFEPQNVTPEEVAMFGKLHQYEWNRTMAQTGNDGGHFGAYCAGPSSQVRFAAVSVLNNSVGVEKSDSMTSASWLVGRGGPHAPRLAFGDPQLDRSGIDVGRRSAQADQASLSRATTAITSPAVRSRQLEPSWTNRGIDLTYTDKVEALNPKTLGDYDGLIIYANTTQIAPEQEKALLDFVAGGKGFIPLHCASYCFLNSPKYIELVGAQFQQTRHRHVSHADSPLRTIRS